MTARRKATLTAVYKELEKAEMDVMCDPSRAYDAVWDFEESGTETDWLLDDSLSDDLLEMLESEFD